MPELTKGTITALMGSDKEYVKRVLVTGASGFVGRYMEEEASCVPLESETDFADVRSIDEINKALRTIQPDAVIHLAAQSYVPRSFEDPRETFDINFIGTYNLLKGLKTIGFTGRFLSIGSGNMYGFVPPDKLPIQENYPLRPRDPYAVSKVAAEALCYQWSQTEPFDIIMTRSFNHIGPRQSERFVISDCAKQIVEISLGRKEAIIHVGDIDVTRDFTDVRDTVRAYWALIESGESGEVYNVCSGKEYPIRDLITTMLEIAEVEARIEQQDNRLRRDEQRRVVGSNAKLVSHTGWSQTIPIHQSLRDVLIYWKGVLS